LSELNTELAEAKAEEMKAEGTFDLASALKGTSYPTDDASIFLDGESAHALNMALNEIAELGFRSAGLTAEKNGGITDDPEKEEIDAQIAELEAEQRELIAAVSESRLTFKLRGVAPKAWKLIIKSWNRKSKAEAKEHGMDEEERVDWANDKINAELIAKSIVSITDAKGNVQKGAVKIETVEDLQGSVLQSEFAKLLDTANSLTFANGLFANAIAADADFLSKLSADPASVDTSLL
jgi:hypothetical protein